MYSRDFIAGMELAEALVRRTGVRDPEHLRAAARAIRALAASDVELGAAQGLEILAAAEEDGRDLEERLLRPVEAPEPPSPGHHPTPAAPGRPGAPGGPE